MIKNAIEYVLGLSKAGVVEVDGKKYFANHEGISPVLPEMPKQPTTQSMTTLASIVDYIRRNTDGMAQQEEQRLIIHIESPTKVSLKTEIFGHYAQRTTLIEARPMIPEVGFDQWMDTERFNIYLQSRFVNTPDRNALLQCVGSIAEENVQNTGDDGVSQTVTVRVGVVTNAKALVPNPVKLAPYRTFIEVEQPESDFIFRMQNGPKCALFEADGGAWKVEAMGLIAAYFTEELTGAIANNQVIILC